MYPNAISCKRSEASWRGKGQQTVSTESARHESFERQHTSMAHRNRKKVARGAGSKGLRVGLHLFGFLEPASSCLWWSKALLNFKGTWVSPLAV